MQCAVHCTVHCSALQYTAELYSLEQCRLVSSVTGHLQLVYTEPCNNYYTVLQWPALLCTGANVDQYGE